VLTRCQADRADAVVLVADCPVCHQTLSLTARVLEKAGIPTVLMGAALDIVERCGVPRFLFSDLPLGNAAGLPFDPASQDTTLALALDLLESASGPRTTRHNPVEWPGSPGWRRDYLNLDGLTAADLAQARQLNDQIKAVAQAVRDTTLSTGP